MKRFNTKNNPTRQYKDIKKNLNQTRHLLKRGQFGLRSLEYMQVSINQVNNLRKLLQKEVKQLEKKSGLGKIKIWFYMLPKNAVTKFSPETRMGKGKGPIVSYCCYIRPGQLLFELSNIPRSKVAELTEGIKNALSFKVQPLLKFYQT